MPSPRWRLLRARTPSRRVEHGSGRVAQGLPVLGRPAHDGLLLRSGARNPDSAPRHDDGATFRALVEENAALARELGRIQRRSTAWRDDCIVQTERLQATLMRARAHNIAQETRLAALRETLDALRERAAVWLTNEELLRRMSDLRARNRSLEAQLSASRHAVDPTRAPGEPAGAAAALLQPTRTPTRTPAPPSAPAAADLPRRVLCVGGRARQIPVYRELVERAGGTFTHVDGSPHDCLRQLERLLADADVVVLQAGYVCDGACRAVEHHCARTAKRCVRLSRPCALGFARSLFESTAAAPGSRQP